MFKNTPVEQEANNHSPIKLSVRNKAKLFLLKTFDYAVCSFKKSFLSRRLLKLFKLGNSRLEVDLNIEKIIKSLRDLKILLKSNVLDEDLAFQIQHHHKNVIDLDSDDSQLQLKTKKMNTFELAIRRMVTTEM